VWVSEDQVYVGTEARKWADSDPDNVCMEFKLKMDDPGWRTTFPDTGRMLSAPDLSTEVLKSLRGDVQQATGEIIEASVITVPAAFELDQCEATGRRPSWPG
jgi:molecular chaperone DnaK